MPEEKPKQPPAVEVAQPLPIGYDIAANPDADDFDPVAWYEGTGEDLGLPVGFLEADRALYQQFLAEAKARAAEEPAPEPEEEPEESAEEERHLGPGPHDSGTPQSVHGDREGASQQLEKQAEAGGFTYRRIAGAPKDGFMVSPYPEAEFKEPVADFDADDVRRYRREHRALLSRPGHFLGGWRDGDTIYLDISIRSDTVEEAARIAREKKQLAIYDLATGREIPTEEVAA